MEAIRVLTSEYTWNNVPAGTVLQVTGRSAKRILASVPGTRAENHMQPVLQFDLETEGKVFEFVS